MLRSSDKSVGELKEYLTGLFSMLHRLLHSLDYQFNSFNSMLSDIRHMIDTIKRKGDRRKKVTRTGSQTPFPSLIQFNLV